MALPVIAIVGRPNTGKSTLFNRIVGKRKAIVDDIPGVTRDWVKADVEWRGKSFTLIDTGGFDPHSREEMGRLVYLQTLRAVEEADIIILLMDGKEGFTPLDMEIVNRMRKTGKRVFYAVNKMDAKEARALFPEFYSAGVERLFPISAEHGEGIEELLEEVLKEVPLSSEAHLPSGTRLAIIGRPNVGKSSLMNRLLGKERAIISPIPGTTRDALEESFEWKGRKYVIVDTAGIRRKSRVKTGIEYFSVNRAISAVEASDIVILMVDIWEGIVEQDLKLLSLALERGKGVCIALNKADLITRSQRKKILSMVKETLRFADYIPFSFTSCVTGEGIDLLMGIVYLIEKEMEKRIKTSLLNRYLREVVNENPPPRVQGRKGFVLYYSLQTSSKPPQFLLFCNNPDLANEEYIRFLERKIRERFGFTGLPISVKMKKSE